MTACFFGDGAVAEGEFHECMNLAALWQLPVLFCCENNLYAMGTALERSESETDLALKAASYEGPRGRWTEWTSSPSKRPPWQAHGRGGAQRWRAPLPRVAHLPFPRPLDVRPRAVPHQDEIDLRTLRPLDHDTIIESSSAHSPRGRHR